MTLVVTPLVGLSVACNLQDPVAAQESGPTDPTEDATDTSDAGNASDTGEARDGSDRRDVEPREDSSVEDVSDVRDGGSCAPNEACDGDDDDCDGTVDEGCPCTLRSSKGVCGNATIAQDGSCEPPSSYSSDEVQRCRDGLDNDCDGKTDEATKAATSSCTEDCECRSGRCDSNACAHRIFVTLGTHNGSFGGFSGANQICASAARSAGLSGSWKALLSDSTTAAKSRISIGASVVNVDGTLVSSQASFWTPTHSGSVYRAADGTIVGCTSCTVDKVWTGSTDRGERRTHFCDDWTDSSGSLSGEVGDAGDANYEWIAEDSNNPYPCNQAHHLYCIDGQ